MYVSFLPLVGLLQWDSPLFWVIMNSGVFYAWSSYARETLGALAARVHGNWVRLSPAPPNSLCKTIPRVSASSCVWYFEQDCTPEYVHLNKSDC
jgi:hypothetical protein